MMKRKLELLELLIQIQLQQKKETAERIETSRGSCAKGFLPNFLIFI